MKSLASLRTDAEVLSTRHGPFLTKWYFSPTDRTLLAMETKLKDAEDPCEVYFSDYRPEGGRLLLNRHGPGPIFRLLFPGDDGPRVEGSPNGK